MVMLLEGGQLQFFVHKIRWIYKPTVGCTGQLCILTNQTRDVGPMLIQCRANVVDGEPTLNQYRVNVSCLLGKDGIAEVT